jgi:peptide/nickel transport system substrate-binding protein
MEHRFGVKDFFLFLLITILIVSVWLAMKQYDRQLIVLQALQSNAQEQTGELARMRRTLEENAGTLERIAAGGLIAPATNPTDAATRGAQVQPAATADQGDPFAPIKEARKNPDYARGDWLISNFGTTVNRLTPLVAGDLYSVIVQNRIFETLGYRDPNTLKFVPLLARSWQVSADGLKITFQLRRGVVFSDGAPLTADDVVFSYQWAMNPKVNAPRVRAYLNKITSVDKTGDYEVVFHFKEPYYESLALAAEMYVLPRHFYSQFAEEAFNQAPGLLLGSGPYRVRDPKGWRPGQQIELVRNERYWGEPGPFNKLVYLEVEEDAAELTMFQNGELDIYGVPDPAQYLELLKNPAVTSRAQNYETESLLSGYSFIAWNQVKGGKPTRWADKRVRQAMTLLADRDRICKEIFLGFAQPQPGPFARLSPASDPTVKPLPYDSDKAKALLKEAGFEDRNGDGVIESADGEPFRFKLTTARGSPVIERLMLMLKDSYAKAGIVMELDPVDWPILQKKCDSHDFDGISLGWATDVESDLYQIFHSSQIDNQGDNWMSYRNPELDKLVEQARSTIDDARRFELWHQCHRIIADDQPYTFLTSRRGTSFMDKRIHNVQKSKLGLNYNSRSAMPYPWYVPKAMQKYKD